MLTSAREVIINFRSKTRGLYEIVEPVLEESEVFDSSLLKETINSLIASGKRNFALDMSPLDYIYSDTINMLMALNRRVLDVTGRLSIMAPQPEVLQILKRAGIHNVLRIFETETELIKSSEDMILQTTSIKLSDVNAAMQQPPAPESEFDQLRSEIGSVFGDTGHHGETPPPAQPKPPQQNTENDDFNEMFQQFEQPTHSQPKPSWGAPPVQPQAPRFQPQQYSPPSGPQAMPLRPSAPGSPYPSQQPQSPDVPKQTQDFSSVRSETQRFSTAPAKAFEEHGSQGYTPPPQKGVSFDDDLFDTSKKKSIPKKVMREDFDSLDDDFDEFKKKSPLPKIIVVLLVLILGGTVAYLAMSLQKKGVSSSDKAGSLQTKNIPPAATTPAYVPVDSQAVADSATADTASILEPVEEIVKSKPEIPPAPAVSKPVKRTPVRRKTTRPRARAKASTRKPPTNNKVAFTSSPTGADIRINGQRIGRTPFTWKKPFFGTVNVKIGKSGYEDSKKSFEFKGGSISEHFSLDKKVVKAPPPPPQRKVTRPVVKKTAPPPPVEDDDDPFTDIGDEEDDFNFDEPEESAPVRAAVKPTSTPARTTPVRTKPAAPASTARSTPTRSIGGNAQIFIASIPPVADVYLGDNLIGKTNVSELKLPAGTQSLRFVKGGKEITKVITLKPGKNPSQMVRIP